ncbi:MAG: opacity protein-like surface antigen [Arenicella sp.]|jgi:opacity protein-like surface antigen
MKSRTLFFSLLLIFSAQLGFSQIQEGAILLGGQFTFNVSETDYGSNSFRDPSERTIFIIQPQLGFALSEKLIVGTSLGYRNEKETRTDFFSGGPSSIEATENLFAVAPFVRNYFEISEKFYFYLQGDASIGFGKATLEDENGNEFQPEADLTAFSIGVRPGVSFFVSDKVALEAEFGFLGYSQEKSKQEFDFGGGNSEIAKTTDSNYGLSLNSTTFNFGFSLYLGR